MKSAILLLCILFVFTFCETKSQVVHFLNEGEERSGFSLSVHAGYDIPKISNGMHYIDYKGGWIFGAGLSRYWEWIGVGIDLDHVTTNVRSRYPSDYELYLSTDTIMKSSALEEKNIQRIFIGLGPDLKTTFWENTMMLDLGVRIGSTSVNGGRVMMQETTTPAQQILLYHSGYQNKSVLTAKIKLALGYISEKKHFGIHAGGYLFKYGAVRQSKEAIGSNYGILQPFSIDPATGTFYKTGNPHYLKDVCDCEFSSMGAYIAFRLWLFSQTEAN